MKTRFLIAGSMLLILSACAAGEDGESGGGIRGLIDKVTDKVIEKKEVFEDQDRNGSCWKDKNCKEGLTCKNATKETPGTCQMICSVHSDCGNNYLCRDGECQRDCAEKGEKCSDRRVCCFFDEDGDKETDTSCVFVEEEKANRCLIGEADEEAEEIEEIEDDEEEEDEEAEEIEDDGEEVDEEIEEIEEIEDDGEEDEEE